MFLWIDWRAIHHKMFSQSLIVSFCYFNTLKKKLIKQNKKNSCRTVCSCRQTFRLKIICTNFRILSVWQIQEGCFGFLYFTFFATLHPPVYEDMFMRSVYGLSKTRYLSKLLSRILPITIFRRNALIYLSVQWVLLFHHMS